VRIAVVTFPGSNCDDDCHHVFGQVLGHDTQRVWHKETKLPQGTDAVVLPGGFSYGDYLRCGAIARFSPIMQAVVSFAKDGGTVLGICNGFQILCEAGLLPGALLRNRSQRFICETVPIRCETVDTRLTQNATLGQVLNIPIAHADGNYFIDDDGLSRLEDEGQVLFRYCSPEGEVGDIHNPNGSKGNIAGITNSGRNVFGMMPHPERISELVLGGCDGRLLMEGVVQV
jgi:phosphoribosylformylglycinamidine synthase I